MNYNFGQEMEIGFLRKKLREKIKTKIKDRGRRASVNFATFV